MVHAIEAYTSRHKKNPMSDQMARQALALLSQNIREVCRNGQNLEARSQMLLGSMLAGMAFANAPVAAVHALAYPIGAIFHVPHGLSNALVLMGVLRFNLPAAETLYAELHPSSTPRPPVFLSPRQHHGSCRASPPSAATARCRHPWRRSAFGKRSSQLAEDAMKQTRLLINNPREVTYADAFAIYGEALDGKQRRRQPSDRSVATRPGGSGHESIREHAGAWPISGARAPRPWPPPVRQDEGGPTG